MEKVQILGNRKYPKSFISIDSDPRYQLFDLITSEPDIDTGGFEIAMVVNRMWQKDGGTMKFIVQAAVFDGTPQTRANILKQYGYIS